jgi:hypothetical protein
MVFTSVMVDAAGFRKSTAQTVEGEDLMRLLRDAQLANESKYPFGELWASVEAGEVETKQFKMRTEVHLRWNGRRSRVSAKQTVWLPPEFRGPDGGDTTVSSMDYIEDEQRLVIYWPEGKTAHISPRLSVAPPDLTSLRPDQLWYRSPWCGRPWIEMLGPHSNFPQEDIVSYHFKKLGADQIQLERVRKSGTSRFRAVASLADEGNIVEVETYFRDDSIEQASHGDYKWSRDAKQRCFLDAVEFRSRNSKKGKSPHNENYVRMKMDRIDLDAKPEPSLFEIASLAFSPGTQVIDQVNNKRYRIGDMPVAKVTSSLDDLIEEMSRRGFARPSR